MQRLRRRLPVTFSGRLALGIVAAGGVWLALQFSDVLGPRYQGRTAEGWVNSLFEVSQFHRESEVGSPVYRAQAALLRMGTEAYPALVETALADPPDSRLRQFLRPFVNLLGGRVGYPGEKATYVRDLFREWAPRAGDILPLLEPALRSDPETVGVALGMIDVCRDEDGTEAARWERRRQAGGDGFPVRICEDVLVRLRPPSDAAVEVAARRVSEFARTGSGSDWAEFQTLALAGNRARASVPELERFLEGADQGGGSMRFAIMAGVSLLEIDPHHARAGSWMRAQPWLPAFNNWNQVTNSHVESLLGALIPFRELRSAVTLEVVEAIVRDQVSAWETRGLNWHPSDLLERIAPARAQALFQAQMTATNKDNIRLHAAGSVLRVNGLDTHAVAVLAACLRDDHGLQGMAIEQLMYASDDNPALPPVLADALPRSARFAHWWNSHAPQREYRRLVAARKAMLTRPVP